MNWKLGNTDKTTNHITNKWPRNDHTNAFYKLKTKEKIIQKMIDNTMWSNLQSNQKKPFSSYVNRWLKG